MQKVLTTALILGSMAASSFAAVTLQVDAAQGHKAINPAIYGKNHGISDNPTTPTADSMVALYKDVGVKILRLSGGNNQTKYNWRKKLSSHPDWFNNVYAHDWDYSAQEVQSKLPGVQGLFSLQLIGWAASNATNNWNDYQWSTDHNGSYPSTAFNLAGGGDVSADGSTVTTAGIYTNYLESWPADSTVGILGHWFGTGAEAIGLDTNRFRYWNMDNEPDIWSGTHDDVITSPQNFEDFFTKYVTVAKKARATWPGIQLVGPVLTNEWQWWTWEGSTFTVNSKKMSPMEYFLYRIGQEEATSGVKLLDVFDLHFYPDYNSASNDHKLLQLHRMLWDTTYKWPDANGIHMIDNKWNTPVPYYLYVRIQDWMNQYLGAGRARVAMTEFGAANGSGDANVHAANYASLLGSFADNGLEIFTPWDWYSGWYEVMHLYTTYAKPIRVLSTSSIDSTVSAYSSINAAGDSLTVILVNRDEANAQSATVNLANFIPSGTNAATFRLSGLSGETFISASQNALQSSTVSVTSNAFTMSLPSLSVTAVVLATNQPNPVASIASPASQFLAHLEANRLQIALPSNLTGSTARLIDVQGHVLGAWKLSAGQTRFSYPLQGLVRGNYLLHVQGFGYRNIAVIR